MFQQVLITALAFVIGIGGIAGLIGVGEVLDNGIAAFAVVVPSLPIWPRSSRGWGPRARGSIAVALAAPVVIIGFLSEGMGSLYVPEALWTMSCSRAGAYAGGQARKSRSGDPPA